MKYVSIDIETTGLDRQNDQILEIGAIIEDTNNPLPFEKIPKFQATINRSKLSGSVFALNMNARIIELLADMPWDDEKKKEYKMDNHILDPEDVGLAFYSFLTSNGYEETSPKDSRIRIICAGKNFASFDRPFIENSDLGLTTYINMGHRCLDPVSLFTDFKNDVELPNSDMCLVRSGIETSTTHIALFDAWDVVQMLRTKY